MYCASYCKTVYYIDIYNIPIHVTEKYYIYILYYISPNNNYWFHYIQQLLITFVK